MIFLRALGTAEIDTGTVTLTPSQEIVFAAALYLIVERGKPVSRNRIASLLWPRVAESARGHRLRQTIHQLKKLGMSIEADRDVLRLAENGAHSDIGSFSDKDYALCERRGFEFLPGYNPSFSEPFQDWVDTVRQREHSMLTETFFNARHTTVVLTSRNLPDLIQTLALHKRLWSSCPATARLFPMHFGIGSMRGAKRQTRL